MIAVQGLLTLLTALLAGLCLASGAGLMAGVPDALLVALFIAMAFIAATNDIAIDGYYMEGISDPKQQAAYTGFRVMAYRLAMILARFGVILAVAEVAKTTFGGNMYSAWGFGFAAAAVVMAVLTGLHLIRLPRYQEARRAGHRGARGGVRLPGLLRRLSGGLPGTLPDRPGQRPPGRPGHRRSSCWPSVSPASRP